MVFHEDCFKCSACKNLLAGQPYGFNEGNFYCAQDLKTLFAKTCGRCKKTINGNYVQAANRYWCEAHFQCEQCRKKITSDSHRIHDKQPYCEDCFSKITDYTCRRCEKPIDHRELVQSMGLSFHVGCFICCMGDNKQGSDQKYFELDKKTYCQKHWEESNLVDNCGICRKPIDNDYVRVMGKNFHTKCWKCADCKFVIRTKEAISHNGLFYCKPCVDKRNKTRQEEEEKARWEAILAKRMIRGYDYEAAPGTIPPNESKCYPLATLLLRPPHIPTEIDFRQREQYLEKWEFKKVFGVEMDEFNTYPLWRRLMMKKEIGLF